MDSTKTIDKRTPPAAGECWLVWLTYGAAAVLFLPVAFWLVRQTRASDQLLHAIIVLGLCGVFLWFENRGRIQAVFQHDRASIWLLWGAFACMGMHLWWPHPLLLLAGFLLMVASLVRFSLGREAARLANALLGSFFLFVGLAVLLPIIDWPLRYLAGSWSGSLLEALGHGIQLLLVTQPELHLRLYVDGHPFLVAPECNGFGVISASLLVAVLFAIYLRTGVFDGLLLVVSALVIALAANVLRIVAIVSLAPHVENYLLMHEIVGSLFFYAALGLLLWLIVGFRKKPLPVSPSD